MHSVYIQQVQEQVLGKKQQMFNAIFELFLI